MTPEDRLTRVENALSTLVELAQRADERMTRLEKMQQQTDAAARALLAAAQIQAQEIKDLGESVKAVDERSRRTDERLDALITTVERFISGGRGGQG